ncbi:MAG TPA: response regulator [Polyangiaceae bacterium]
MSESSPLSTDSPSPATPGKLRDVRVLVVDDNEDTLDLIAIALESEGARVMQAASVPAAMSIVLGNRLDVLVSDIGMPGEDGYDLMRRLRADGSSARGLPAVAVTAFGAREDRLKALAVGFQEHLQKPFDAASLVDVVARLATGMPPQNGA